MTRLSEKVELWWAMNGQTMRAWALDAFGRSNLRQHDLPIPKPQAGEVLVRVHAASLNYRDKLVIDGNLLPELPIMPFIPLSDMAGEVVAIGENVERVFPGDRVISHFWTTWLHGPPTTENAAPNVTLGGPLQGVISEFTRLPQDALVKMPETLSFEEASTLPIAALTAWMALDQDARSLNGKSILVQGTGGVSLFALQFAKALGLRIMVTSRSDEKIERVLSLGAAFGVNTAKHPEWAQKVLELTNNSGVDMILETVGGANMVQSLNALTMNGTIAQIGFLSGIELQFPAPALMLKRATLRGIAVGDRRSFEQMNHLIEAEELHPIIDEVYPFERLPDALDRLDYGPFGKVVITGFGE